MIRWGFGYDAIADEYKVVALVSIHKKECEPIETEVMVYNTNTESWKSIGKFPGGCLPMENSGKFLRGKLHWSYREENKIVISSLDLAAETYWVVDKLDYDVFCNARLDVFQGSLCLLHHQNHEYTEVWVMKDYGIRESWSKKFCIPCNKPSRHLVSKLVCLLEDNQVLVICGSNLALYSIKYNCFRDVLFRTFDACVYVESPISPTANYGFERHQLQGLKNKDETIGC